MWQLFLLGSLVCSSAENIIDKVALTGEAKIDTWTASFWRSLLFCLATVAIGFLGWFGPLSPSFHWIVIPLAGLAALASVFYTCLLKRVELTATAIAAYLAPFVFLSIDTSLLRVPLTAFQVTGIVLLVLGGVAFSIDGETSRFKEEFTPRIWGMLAFGILWSGSEAYAFKYLNEVHGVNGVSFFATTWTAASALLLVGVIGLGRARLLLGSPGRLYLRRSIASKSLDAASSALWAQALLLATVSQVSAFGAFAPLVLLLMVMAAQNLFGVGLGERLARKDVLWKICGLGLLVTGGWLAR